MRTIPLAGRLGLSVSLVGFLAPSSCTLSSAAPAVAAAPLTVRIAGAPKGLIARRRAELRLELSGGAAPYRNPFDPDQVALDLRAVGPGGRTLTIPAFWWEPAEGSGDWRVRINLPTAGRWTLIALAHDTAGEARSTPVSVTVAAPDTPGFVRRADGAGRRRYLRFDDGRAFFPVGENLCWAGRDGVDEYARWLGALHMAEANYVRLWMSPRALEGTRLGAGRYEPQSAEYFDRVLELAERNGIYCMLCFMTYGELKTGGYFNEGAWARHPYNAANGGPVPAAKPADFFTNPEARRLYRQRLRYLVARYGAYRSVAFWEFWNEFGGPRDWFVEMGQALAQADPYDHLITNSYQTTGPAEIWRLPEMALTQTHRYGDEGSVRDFADEMVADTRAHDPLEKPHLMGEFGITWRGPDAKFDPEGNGVNLHNGLWASAASGAAGGAATWWWDNYIHPKNLYGAFTGLARFSKTVDWPNRAFEPLSVPAPRRTRAGGAPPGDAVIRSDGAWGSVAQHPLELSPDGALSGSLPGYLYGPVKPDLHRPLRLRLRLARPTTVTLRVGRVSNRSRLAIARNGQPLGETLFDAAQGGPGGYRSTKFFPEHGVWQAQFDRDVAIPLPAGESTLTLENLEGDWLSIESLRVPGVVPADVASARPIALQDGRSGETVLWLQDPGSHWRQALEKIPLAPQAGLRLTVPLPAATGTAFRAIWWDTRAGKPLRTDPVSASGRSVALAVPTFTRDIALHLVPK